MTTRAARLCSVLLLVVLAAACSGDETNEVPADAACSGEKYFADTDGDGFGNAAVEICQPMAGYVAKQGDCDDSKATIHPGATEHCDLIDNNCDGKIDDADPLVDTSLGSTFYADTDGDGFGAAATTRRACKAPAGFTTCSTDCNDASATINPSATEVCDQIDNDCDHAIDIADSSVDLATAHSYYRDFDNDTYGAGTAMIACSKPSGYVLQTGDCNDMDNTSKPGAVEVCDGADNNCDGGIDGTAAAPNQCTALVGTYSGSYSHLAQEKLGMSVINSMQCTGTGSASLLLNRKPAVQGTFSCVYGPGLTLFDQTQQVKLFASVGLDGTVTGTIEHNYANPNLKRTYNVTGTQTATSLVLTGTGSFFPHPMSAVAWQVTFSFNATR